MGVGGGGLGGIVGYGTAVQWFISELISHPISFPLGDERRGGGGINPTPLMPTRLYTYLVHCVNWDQRV